MTIKTFIEKAIKGGWNDGYEAYSIITGAHDGPHLQISDKKFSNPAGKLISIHEIIVDPRAWQAVGKVEGWNKEHCVGNSIKGMTKGSWLYYQHTMIDALAEGKSIEEFLETL